MSYISKKECAGILGVCTRTIEREMKKGLPYIKVGKSIRFNMDEVLNWIKNKE